MSDEATPDPIPEDPPKQQTPEPPAATAEPLKETKKKGARPVPARKPPPSNIPVPPKPTGTTAGAVTVGAGGGTIFVAIANQLSVPQRTVLLYAAPSLSVFISAVWVWMGRKLDEYFYNRKIDGAFRQAITAIDEALAAEGLPADAKESLETRRREIHQMIVELRIQVLTEHISKKR